MHTITHDNLSYAWAEALQWLADRDGGKAVHLAVAIQRPDEPEDERVRALLDGFIAARRQAGSSVWPVSTVANTLFPKAFYRPGRRNARDRLYELHAKAQSMHSRLREPENYFDRLVAYPAAGGTPFNQLEYVVDRLINQRKPRKDGRIGALSSAYEVGLTVPDGDLRIQAPDEDRNTMGFPCLSHISFTLEKDLLNLAALYRNQHFIARAYGNYIGLARLGKFIASEVPGVELGEIVCLATHADAEFKDFNKSRVQRLAKTALDATLPLEALSA